MRSIINRKVSVSKPTSFYILTRWLSFKEKTTMRQIRKTIYVSVIIILGLSSCKSPQKGFIYKKDGKKHKDNISCDCITKNGNLQSAYISDIKFGYLDSISFPNNNPDNMISYISYKPLNFNKKQLCILQNIMLFLLFIIFIR